MRRQGRQQEPARPETERLRRERGLRVRQEPWHRTHEPCAHRVRDAKRRTVADAVSDQDVEAPETVTVALTVKAAPRFSLVRTVAVRLGRAPHDPTADLAAVRPG